MYFEYYSLPTWMEGFIIYEAVNNKNLDILVYRES